MGWRFKKRPGLDYFLQQCAQNGYEIVIFSHESASVRFILHLYSISPISSLNIIYFYLYNNCLVFFCCSIDPHLVILKTSPYTESLIKILSFYNNLELSTNWTFGSESGQLSNLRKMQVRVNLHNNSKSLCLIIKWPIYNVIPCMMFYITDRISSHCVYGPTGYCMVQII